MVTEKILEAALGISSPWFIAGMSCEPNQRTINIRVDFEVRSRFAAPGQTGEHLVHDTVTKNDRHLNSFQHECVLEVRLPRVKLPNGSVRQISPPWAGKLCGFTLLFGAFVLLRAREMTFLGVSHITGLSAHRVQALTERYVNEAVALADYSKVVDLAIDETSRAKGHDHVSIFADASPDPLRRRVIYVAEGRYAETVTGFERNLRAHHGKPSEIRSISIDMPPAFISGVENASPTRRPRSTNFM